MRAQRTFRDWRTRRAARTIVPIACLLGFGVALAAPPAEYSDLLDASSDEVLRRAFVPSDEKPHGEVRLVRRRGGRVVQTVLYSKLLKRAVGRILDKERHHWPESSAGHEAMVAYTQALVAARERVSAEFKERKQRADRRQGLLIEFVLIGGAALVAVAEPQVEVGADFWRVVGRRELTVLEPGKDYVRTNMRLIVVDALGLEPTEAEQLLP